MIGRSPLLLTLATLSTSALVRAEAPVEEIVVTGTRLPDTQPGTLITIDRAAIERSGVTTLSGLFRDLTVAASGTIDEQFTQGFAPASAAANLRGLGVSRTLVLLNGRRLPIFPFAEGGSQSFVDLNLIPLGSMSASRSSKTARQPFTGQTPSPGWSTSSRGGRQAPWQPRASAAPPKPTAKSFI